MTYNPEIHKRKSIRLKNYNYAKNGMYFITICTKNREPILSKIENVGVDALIDPKIKLQYAGKILNKYIKNINDVYKKVNIDSYVIMPDHFHMIINIMSEIKLGSMEKLNPGPMKMVNPGPMKMVNPGPMRASAPTTTTKNEITISQIIKGIKSLTTREIGYSIWQRNYYEHIIRNQEEYHDICKYIKQNPQKWIQNKM